MLVLRFLENNKGANFSFHHHLQRGQLATGLVSEALLARAKVLFHYDPQKLFKIHEAQAPVDLVIDITHLYRRINPNRLGAKCQPQDLSAVFEDLPNDTPLAL